MSVGKSERLTQNRVIALFQDELDCRYLGNWEYRNSLRQLSGSVHCCIMACRC